MLTLISELSDRALFRLAQQYRSDARTVEQALKRRADGRKTARHPSASNYNPVPPWMIERQEKRAALAKRNINIVRLARRGLSHKEIGDQVNLAAQTVRQIIRKELDNG